MIEKRAGHFVFAAFVLGTLFVASGPESMGQTVDPKSEEVLKGMFQILTDARNLQCTTIVTVHVKSGEKVSEQDTKGDLLIERPNKVVLEVAGGQIPFNLTSDGTEVYTMIPSLAAYTAEEAPDRLQGLIKGVLGNLISQQLPFHSFLFADSPREAFLVRAASVEYLGEEETDGIPCQRIRVHQEPSGMDLYIEAGQRPVLRRIVPDTSNLVASLRQTMPDIEVEMKVRFDDWGIDSDLPKDAFAFTPPDWVERKESFLAPRREDAAKELVGKKAPDLKVLLLDGSEFDLSAQTGKKIAIVEFWATWCGPCVMSLPILSEVAKEYENKSVVFVAVNVDAKTPSTVQAFMEKYGLNFNAALDDGGMAAGRFRVGPIPQTVIVGKDGVVQDVQVGLGPNLKEELSGKLDVLLEGRNLY